ncbi:MAG: hypothetical protein WCT32_02110 [Patescibacteria group bacterium]|jgi:hypothetical protein
MGSNDKQNGLSVRFAGTTVFPGYDRVLSIGYNSKVDGPIDKFLPILFESRFEDLSVKINLVLIAGKEIHRLVDLLERSYNKETCELTLNPDSFDKLQLYANYLLVESRSILEIIEQINKLVFPKLDLPSSFTDFLKHKRCTLNDLGEPYFEALQKARDSAWLKMLLSLDRSRGIAARDIRTHFSHLYVFPHQSGGKIEFFITARPKVNDIYILKPDKPELLTTTDEIIKGILELIRIFKSVFPPAFFAQLLHEKGYQKKKTANTP